MCNLSYFSHSTFKIPQSLFLMVMLLPFNRIGYVKLSNYLILHNVLFVPMFAFNFLSISALILDYNCCINFLSNSCVIQDLTQGLMIGKGKKHNNLYFPRLGIIVCNSMFSCFVMSKSDVWNFRLGHSSPIKIQFLHNEFHIPNSLFNLSSHCQICHIAKQKHLPFVSHNHMSAKPFDLVHSDI